MKKRHKTIIQIVLVVYLTVSFLCVLQLTPSCDDLPYLSSPFSRPFGLWERLLPNYYFWRPFDGLYGLFATRFPLTFPWLNHTLVYAAHVLSAWLLMRLLRVFRFDDAAALTAVTLYVVSPAATGTLQNIDSLNQSFSTLWGLAALTAYAHDDRWRRLWLPLALLSVFSKESGLAWLLLAPLLSCVFGVAEKKEAFRGLAAGVTVTLCYAVARFALLHGEPPAVRDPNYMVSLMKAPRNLALWVLWTWVPADFPSQLVTARHDPVLFALTALAAVPLLCWLWWVNVHSALSRQGLTLLAAMLLSVCVNMVTTLGAMHCLCSLPFVALFVAHVVQTGKRQRWLAACAVPYLAACLFSFYSHWSCSLDTCQRGAAMAKRVVRAMEGKKKPQRVFTVTLEGGDDPYSTFWLPTSQVFWHGMLVRWATGYAWPSDIKYVALEPARHHLLEQVCDSVAALGYYDQVWIVHGDSVSIVESEKITGRRALLGNGVNMIN